MSTKNAKESKFLKENFVGIDKFFQNLTPDTMYYTRTNYQLKIFCRTPEYAKMFQMKISKIT